MRAIHCMVCNMLSAQDRYSSSFSCSLHRNDHFDHGCRPVDSRCTSHRSSRCSASDSDHPQPSRCSARAGSESRRLGSSSRHAGSFFSTGAPAPAPPAGTPAPSFPPEPAPIPVPETAVAGAEPLDPSAPAEQYLRVCQRCGKQSYIREKVCLNEWCEAWNCCEY